MRIYKNSVTAPILPLLQRLMEAEPFAQFRVEGDTALALQLGHRRAGDIHLSRVGNESDLEAAESYLNENFAHVERVATATYFIGDDPKSAIKLTLTLSEGEFSELTTQIEGIRVSTIEELAAVKIEQIARGGSKSDFYDLHALIERFTLSDLISLHEERYPSTHNRERLLEKLNNFTKADLTFDPISQRNISWEEIKIDIHEAVKEAVEEEVIDSILSNLSLDI
ncbi:MAG: nucleotidyl transferase AbiEii/AbiGii toxin family protein [Rikenellaceae bacterium]